MEKEKDMSGLLAWHVSNGFTRSGAQQPAQGESSCFTGDVVWLQSGLYASWKLLDCLPYATGNIVQRVEVEDVVQEGPDKFVCRKRTCVWKWEIEKEFRDFARWAALDAFRQTGVKCPKILKTYLETGDGSDEARELARLCGSTFDWVRRYDPFHLAVYDAAFAACWQNTWDSVGYPAHIAARDASWASSFAIGRHAALTRSPRRMVSPNDIGSMVWAEARAAHEKRLIDAIEEVRS